MVRNYRESIRHKKNLSSSISEKENTWKIKNKVFRCNYDSYFNNNELILFKKNICSFFRKQVLFCIFFKLVVVFLTLIAIYGVYLDQKIRSRIDGKVWQLPAVVYGRMINFEPNMPISKNEMVKLLEAAQYRQASKITQAGEFSVKETTIEMIRRAFDFPDGREGQVRARLTFHRQHLTTIENMDNDRQFGFFRLEPRLITMFSSANGEQRLFLERNGFPDVLVNMLLAIEDRNFYKHDGINLYSIGRALLANLIAGRTVQGASTLTQQLVKNLFLSSKRSYWRKANEAYMAILMDARYSKDHILELYMNEVYFGQIGDNEIRGFPLASLYYFGRPIEELSLDQQALLIGMVKGASTYNPWRNPHLALERRNLILRLLQNQIITQELCDILITRPLGVQSRDAVVTQQPAFMQMVRQELQMKLGDKAKDLSGAKIFTTFDSVAQFAAEKAAIGGILELKKERKLSDLEIAMVVVDRFTGEVRAMVGGAEPRFAGYNRAMQMRRSIGSLAKPATYITALSKPTQYRLNTWITDSPIKVYQPRGKIWSPQNHNKKFSGQVMLVDAFTRSMNIPTVNLGMALGLSAISDTWRKLGVEKDRLYPVPAMILGALNLTPVEVAQAFQTIASNGNRAHLSSLCAVISEDGTVLYQSFPQSERVLPAQATYMVLWIMQQVIQNGTGRQLGLKYPDLHLAGKTGTTNNQVDSWFAGIDGREVVITWVGRDNNQSTKLYGSNGAMMIYQRYLENQSPVKLHLTQPEDIVTIGVDDLGNFVCEGGLRFLPVWTSNSDFLCKFRQPVRSAIGLFEQFFDQLEEKHESNQQHEKESSSYSISDWIKDLFGEN